MCPSVCNRTVNTRGNIGEETGLGGLGSATVSAWAQGGGRQLDVQVKIAGRRLRAVKGAVSAVAGV